jgi:hypothetical protein
VAASAIGAGLLVALLLLTFGYRGPHMDRMYIVTAAIGSLVGLITACGLLARGRSGEAKWGLLLLIAPLVILLLLVLMTPFAVG